MKKNSMPDIDESLKEVNRDKNRLKARLRFAKPIQYGLRKIKNLIKSRPSGVETSLGRRKNEVRFQKEE